MHECVQVQVQVIHSHSTETATKQNVTYVYACIYKILWVYVYTYIYTYFCSTSALSSSGLCWRTHSFTAQLFYTTNNVIPVCDMIHLCVVNKDKYTCISCLFFTPQHGAEVLTHGEDLWWNHSVAHQQEQGPVMYQSFTIQAHNHARGSILTSEDMHGDAYDEVCQPEGRDRCACRCVRDYVCEIDHAFMNTITPQSKRQWIKWILYPHTNHNTVCVGAASHGSRWSNQQQKQKRNARFNSMHFPIPIFTSWFSACID